jgi:hypothetical protein
MNGRADLREVVEVFRRQHLAAQADQLPVDVFSLVEL